MQILTSGRPANAEKSPSSDAIALRQIAHQLRQPLSAIEAIAYYLAISLPPGESKALEQVERMQRLVEDTGLILSDAVYYLGASPPRPERIDLDGVANKALSDAPPADDPLRLSRSPAPVPVWMDAAQAAHMARRLVSHFRRITPEAEPVEVAVSADTGEARMAIRSASSGGSAKDLAALLEPGRPHLGTGPGLAMAGVRRIVDAHGGRIEVQPWPPQGICLSVIFPLAA